MAEELCLNTEIHQIERDQVLEEAGETVHMICWIYYINGLDQFAEERRVHIKLVL